VQQSRTNNECVKSNNECDRIKFSTIIQTRKQFTQDDERDGVERITNASKRFLKRSFALVCSTVFFARPQFCATVTCVAAPIKCQFRPRASRIILSLSIIMLSRWWGGGVLMFVTIYIRQTQKEEKKQGSKIEKNLVQQNHPSNHNENQQSVASERAKLWLPPCSTIGRQILTTEMIFSSLLTANCRPSATPKMTDFIGTDTFIFNFVNILCSP